MLLVLDKDMDLDAPFKALPRLFPDDSGLAMLYLVVSTSVWVSAIQQGRELELNRMYFNQYNVFLCVVQRVGHLCVF